MNSIKKFSSSLCSLVYVNERKIERGQHNVYFNCELFNERFIEYCFVYVTEAKTGAVADIRSDCVPTSPVYGKNHKQFTILSFSHEINLILKVQWMENGDAGVIGANAQQNMLGVFEVVTGSAIVQRQNTMENIARWVN